jgi:hypothetical protein
MNILNILDTLAQRCILAVLKEFEVLSNSATLSERNPTTDF